MRDRRFILGALGGLLSLVAGDALAARKKKAKASAKKAGKKSKATAKKKKAPPRPPSPPPPPPVPTDSDPVVKAALTSAFEGIFNELLAASPLTATSLGFDKGALAGQKAKVDDRGPYAMNANAARLKRAVNALNAVDRSQLNAADRIDYDAVMWDFATQLQGAQTFGFGETATPINTTFYACSPYVVSQLTGLYVFMPDFLDTQHTIATKDDAEAYLARLDGFAAGLDQETDRIRAEGGRSIVPPDFIIAKTIEQLTTLRDADPATSRLVMSLVERTAAAGIGGDWQAAATAKVSGVVRAALDRQISTLMAMAFNARHDAGVRNLPNGEAYYNYVAKVGTSTRLTPREIHALGLQKVSEINAELDTRLRMLGLIQGTPGARMHAMYTDPKYLYANTDEGKAQLINDLNGKVDTVFAKLPGYFGVLPKTRVNIKRIPPAIEAGQPGGYYQPAALDGSRPGTYYINLRDTAEQPAWLLSTLTYHEAMPGHHMQIAIQQEAQGLPTLRKVASFNAYVEGWALYSEQLAGEMGMYDKDAPGRVGYLHDALFRAVRLVVDTGIHSLGWSREQAIQYMVDQTSDAESACASEVDRYCVWPGQALGYMVGKLTWLKIRDAMKAKQGKDFDIKAFHDTGLLAGSMPLDVLEKVYDDRGLT